MPYPLPFKKASIHPKAIAGDLSGNAPSAPAGVSPANDSVDDDELGVRVIDDATGPTGDIGYLSTLLGWIGYMIKSITGKSTWRTAPATTLEACNTHHTAVASASDLGHVKVGSGLAITAGVLSATGTGNVTTTNGTTNALAYWTSSTNIEDAAAFWDSGNAMLRIGGFPGSGTPALYVTRGDGNHAIHAVHTTGVALQGECTTGAGVKGDASGAGGNAVRGTATNATGIGGRFINTSGYALSIEGSFRMVPGTIRNAAFNIPKGEAYIPIDTSGGAFTATLPALSTVDVGFGFIIEDVGMACTTSNLSIARSGTDQFKGAVNGPKVMTVSGSKYLVQCSQSAAGTKQWAVHFLGVV